MAYDIYAQTPVDDGDGVRPQSDAEIEIELRNAARNGDLVVRRRTATGSEFVAGSEPVDLAVEQVSSPMQQGRSQAEAPTMPRPQALSIWRPIKARPNTISGRAHPVGLRPLRCGDQRATQDRQACWSNGATGPAGPKGDTGATGAPARRAQPEQQAPQDRPAQRAQREQLVQRAPRGDVGARVFVGPSTPAPSAANYDIWIVTP